MPDQFDEFRNVIKDGLERNGKFARVDPTLEMLLNNQREIMACIATLARGGQLPISIARDLKARGEKITTLLEG
jgi:hypothetical protein